ncbi:ZIP zinc/iron transport family [Pilatotrama ljubarskyi]|nr:ZIP zinc/iron transport family [Pilatotrama ljubarskyi]
MRHAHILARDDDDDVNCGSGGGDTRFTGLRIASVFVILATSLFGALFPVLARRNAWLRVRVPTKVFDTAKYFGSGVIIATALIHLLDPAIDELGSPCLDPAWQDYPYALGICLISIFIIFISELVAFRWGTAILARHGFVHDAHGHGLPSHAAHGPETDPATQAAISKQQQGSASLLDKGADGESAEGGRYPHSHSDPEKLGVAHRNDVPSDALDQSPIAQIIGVAVLEFGVLLHSVLIGLTLAVDPEFKILFVVLAFHQMFEGLGVGSRLAYLRLPPQYNWVPILGGLLFGITTPIGIAVGLGVRTTYNPDSTTASIVSGVLDSFSAGILLYTGLVELMAHEFLFNADMLASSNGKLAYALGCMVAGAGIMALLGRWA